MKRFTCILLAVIMTFGMVPAAAFAQDEPVALEGVGITLQEGFDSTGINFVAFGASGVSDDNIPVAEYALPESGTYSVKVYRAGDLSLESIIMVGALDVSAKYGKDYKFLEGDYIIEELGSDKTILEQAMDPANVVDENAMTDAELTSETQTAATLEDESFTVEVPAEDDEEKSSLAQLKEAQTLESTRDTSGSVQSAADTLLQTIGLNPIEVFDPSAALAIRFAPGETEKEIFFKIINDSESEGKEVFDLDIKSLDDDTTAAVSPYMLSIAIEDDEPVEHSEIYLTSSKFTAENDDALITIERRGAEYTYATFKIRTLADGNAREGLDFAAVDMEVEFLPDQTETNITIPVVSGKEERSFSVELYDALGCKLGKNSRAAVIIPEDTSVLLLESGTLEGSSPAGGGYGAGTQFIINDTRYKLASMGGSSAFKIIETTAVGDRYVGIFYPPNKDFFSYYNGGDDPNSDSRWDYYPGGVEGQPGPVGYLYWYSNWIWDEGYAKAYMEIKNPWLFQNAYMDLKTDSGLNSVNMGFAATFMRDQYSGSWMWTNDFRSSASQERNISGPVTTYRDIGSGNYKYGGSHDRERLLLHVVAERNGTSACRPEVWFWGAFCFFREFQIIQNAPAKMEYVSVDGDGNMITTKRQPAQVRMLTTERRYPYERVTFACSPYESSVIGGTLIGFNIKPEGTDKVIFRANENQGGDDGFTIDEALLKEIDRLGATATRSGAGYLTGLYVTPVFQYKDAKIEVINDITDQGQAVGSFKYEKEMKSRAWHVGDQLPMAGVVKDAYKEKYSYLTYSAYGCSNPGDPQAAYAVKINPDRYTEHKSFTIEKKKYYVVPEFSEERNFIAVKLDGDASKYFAFQSGDVLSDAEIYNYGNARMQDMAAQGYKILKLSGTAGEKMYTPTPSMAYSLSLVETAANGGKYRPVFSNNWANARVQGFSFDLLASSNYSRNIITVSAEKVDPNQYRYMVLEGKVQYSSVSLRDSSQDLRNVPAEGVVIYGFASPVAGAPAGANMVRISASSDHNGAFSINGVRAIPGDTVSILCQHEGVWQVRYFKLPKSAIDEYRDIYVGTYDPASGKIKYEEKNAKAMVINLMSAERRSGGPESDASGIIDLPIRTNYSPYISNFYYSHTNYPKGSTLGNTCEIVENDSIHFMLDVVTNGVSVSAVKMRFMRDGKEQFVEKAVSEDGRTYQGSVSSSRLMPGYRLEFQIESPEKNRVEFNTEGKQEGQLVDKVFPSIDSGLSFYVPDEAGPSQEISVDIPDQLGKLPLLGNLSNSVGSGKLIYEQSYEYPANPEKGYKYRTVGLSLSRDLDEASQARRDLLQQNLKDKLNNIKRTGGEKAAVDAKASYTDRAAAIRAGQRDAAFNTIDDNVVDPAERQAQKDAWDQGHPIKNYEDTQYKNGLGLMAGDKITVGFTLLLRFEFLYDEGADSWEWTGTGMYINVYGSAGKTFPMLFLGIVPVYLYVGGKVSISAEFAFNYDSAEEKEGLVMRRRMKEMERKSGNITPVMSSGSPWFTIAGNITFYLGLGVNGVFSIRGVGDVNLAVKWNFDERWSPNLGFTWGAAGGIGFDLFIVSGNILFGSYQGLYGAIYQVTPTFQNNKTQKETLALSSSEVGPAEGSSSEKAGITLRELDMGSETYSAFGDEGGTLASTLVPMAEKDVMQGTLEYIRPTTVELDNDHFMLFFLKNMSDSDRDTANASSLCYSIGTKITGSDGNATMAWGNITEIEKDGSFDTLPSAVKIGEDVYVAWSSTNASGSTDVDQVKKDLQNMEIHLAKIKKSSGYRLDNNFGQNGIVTVCDDSGYKDKYLNYNTRLVNEAGKIAVYYLKKDIEKADTADEIMDFETNYSTWARTLINTDGSIIPQKTASGADVDEYLIPIQHPDLKDPFVSQYLVGTYNLANSREYRIAVYTVTKSDKSGNAELWAKIDDLTRGRSFYPIKISQGSESLAQLELTQIRRKAVTDPKQGTTGTVSDLMLTWITDGTKLHTISAHDVFNAIQFEDGNIPDDKESLAGNKSTLGVLSDELSAEDISLPNWPAKAKTKMLSHIDSRLKAQFDLRYPILNAMTDDSAWMEDLGTVKDFGEIVLRTKLDDAGNDVYENVSSGLSLESYHIVSGDDDHVYMFWTWPLSMTDYKEGKVQTGNEIWGSSYETDAPLVSSGSGIEKSLGWSDPVKVTDYQKRADAAKYPNGRVIDEICPVVGTDSGALFLGNSYGISYDADNNIVYSSHNLTEVSCESEGSLKVEDIYLESQADHSHNYYPVPGSVNDIVLTVKNDGLLAAKDYRITVSASVDGKAAKTVKTIDATYSDGDEDTIYAGDSMTFYVSDYTVPEFSRNIKFSVTAQEYKPQTKEAYVRDGQQIKDTLEYTLNRQAMIDFSPVISDESQDPSYMTEDYIYAVFSEFGNTADSYAAKMADLVNSEESLDKIEDAVEKTDPRIASMYWAFPDVEDLADEIYRRRTRSHQSAFVAFIPMQNIGNKTSDKIEVEVIKETTKTKDDGETEIIQQSVGKASCDPLGAGERAFVPVLVTLMPDMIGDLGGCTLYVNVSCGGERIDNDSVAFGYRTQDNVKVLLDTDSETKKIKESDDGTKTLGLLTGESVQLTGTAYPYKDRAVIDYLAYNASDSDDPVINIDQSGNIKALKAGTAYIDVRDTAYGISLYETIKVTVSDSGSGGGSSGGGSSGGGSSSGGSSGGGGAAGAVVTPAKPSATGEPAEHIKLTQTGLTAGNFRDIDPKRWSADAITFCVANGIMNGNGDGTFEPFAKVSRGMMAQVLYNLDRDAAPGNTGRFKDSDELLWFGDAVGWAADSGIVTGNPDGSFGVNDDIDREQAVTMFYRYANKIGLDTTARASLAAFPDAGSVRAYSKDAMEWAVAVGLINGDEGRIRPEGSADREQLATMVMRFVKLTNKQ